MNPKIKIYLYFIGIISFLLLFVDDSLGYVPFLIIAIATIITKPASTIISLIKIIIIWLLPFSLLILFNISPTYDSPGYETLGLILMDIFAIVYSTIVLSILGYINGGKSRSIKYGFLAFIGSILLASISLFLELQRIRG